MSKQKLWPLLGLSKGWAFVSLLVLLMSTTVAYGKPRPRIARDLACSKLNDVSGLSKREHRQLSRACALNTRVRVIVQLTGDSTPAFERFAGLNGASTKKNFRRVRERVMELPIKIAERLAKQDRVKYVSLDRPIQATLDQVTPAEGVGAAVAWQSGYDGSGIGVAVLDSGVANVTDLRDPNTGQSRVVYSEDFVGDGAKGSDLYGHGTHVAGIIAGNGAISDTGGFEGHFAGIAPKTSIINLRVLDANGGGTDSSVIAAIDRAIELKDKYNIRVMNLSVARGVYESYKDDPLDQAVEAAYRAGITVVVAAGNFGRATGTNGYGTVTAPGNDPYVITVGATNMENTPSMLDDMMASYSSKGPSHIDHIVKPDIVAPGNRIISLNAPMSTLSKEYPAEEVFPDDSPCQSNPSACAGTAPYMTLSGTSMATPVVSGAVALLLQQDPSLTPDQVKARLMKTAWKQYPPTSVAYDPSGTSYLINYDMFTVGAGYLDIAAALQDTDKPAGVALSPTANIDPTSGTVSLDLSGASTGNIILWGTSTTLQASSVWGNQVLGSSPDDGSNIILWGTNSVSSDANIILWGTSLASLGSGDSSDSIILWGTSGQAVDIILWGTGLTGAFWDN